MNFYAIYQQVLAHVCGFALLTFGAGLLLAVLLRFGAAVFAWCKRHGLEALVVAPFVVCLVWVGSTKHGSVTYPYTDPEMRYLYDAGSYVTNGYVHVNFTRLSMVPDSADLQGWCRAAGSTNDADWVQFLDATFGAFPVPSDIPFDGAETNDFQFFTTWTPGPAAHTNGVAEIQWRKGYLGTSGAAAVPWRTGVYIDGRRVAPDPAMTNGPSASFSLQLTPNTQNEENNE